MSSMGNQRQIKSDITLLAIIEELQEREGATVTELSDAVDIAKGTAHAHLATLQEKGYVRNEDGEYHLGLRFLNLGIFTRNQQEIFKYSKPVVDEIAEQTGEKAGVIMEENGKAVYLHKGAGERSVRTVMEAGDRRDLHCLAAGKAILAFLPKNRRDEIITNSELERYTENTLTDPEALVSELEGIRERGVAYNLQESIRGLNAIGAPIRGEDDVVHGAISISGPANRLTREKMEDELMDTALGSANEIEMNIRHS